MMIPLNCLTIFRGFQLGAPLKIFPSWLICAKFNGSSLRSLLRLLGGTKKLWQFANKQGLRLIAYLAFMRSWRATKPSAIFPGLMLVACYDASLLKQIKRLSEKSWLGQRYS